MPSYLSPPETAALQERLAAVLRRMENAAAAAGRRPEEVRLICVSKMQRAATVAELARIWQGSLPPAFGENYMQDALEKQEELARLAPGTAMEWHFIGHLQSRKAKDVPGRFDLLHTLDSEKLARILQKNIREQAGTPLAVLLQVNIGREAQKGGVTVEEAPTLAEAVLAMPELSLRGLMCIPPLDGSPAETRRHFAAMRELREALGRRLGVSLPHLSMGMSQDFEAAIAEGATMIRVGTDIFGPRPPR